MAKSRGDFTDILVSRQPVSNDQLAEARSMSQQTGAKIQDTLVKLNYVTNEQVINALSEFHGLQFINLTDVTIAAAVVELVPEPVARENIALPMAHENGALQLIMTAPPDSATVQ